MPEKQRKQEPNQPSDASANDRPSGRALRTAANRSDSPFATAVPASGVITELLGQRTPAASLRSFKAIARVNGCCQPRWHRLPPTALGRLKENRGCCDRL